MQKRTLKYGEVERHGWGGVSDWEYDNVNDAHQRISELESNVEQQGKLIEALIVANARGERIDWDTECLHDEVTFNGRNCDDGGPVMNVQCDYCHQDIVIFRSSIDNAESGESG